MFQISGAGLSRQHKSQTSLLFTCSTFQACNNMFWFEYDMQRTDRTYKFFFSTARGAISQKTSIHEYTGGLR